MIVLPNKNYNAANNEKISTYQFLANVGCPVFDSVLFEENEKLTKEKIVQLKEKIGILYYKISIYKAMYKSYKRWQ